MITRMLKWSAILFLLLVFPLLSGCSDGNKTPNSPIYEDVTVQETYSLIQDNKENENFIILDVRTLQEYSSGHLENAINIDYYSSTFRDSLTALDKDKTYLVYCRSGNRSQQAVYIMEELGFITVYNMLGGILKWIEEELPVVT